MKLKSILLTAVATISFATATMAQVPNYVPTNGLVGWWPFNGNANDESGNNNNGTVNGATLTSDRFGNSGKAYSFDGISNHIRVSDNNSSSLDLVQDYTMSAWVNLTAHAYSPCIITKHLGNIDNLGTYTYLLSSQPYYILQQATPHFDNSTQTTVPSSYQLNQWYYLSCTYNKTQQSLIHYINGIAVDTINVLYDIQNTSIDLLFGASFVWDMNSLDYFWKGKLDDIGIWNRALTQQEITDLYNGCQLTVNTQPNSQTININNNAQFTVGSSDPSATYQWQTDLGVGFQNLNNVGQYSGTINDTLTVSNVTMTNNNQPFRCIISSGSCTDTSNVAVLTVNNNVGINEFKQDNLFSVYPNPAHSQINVKADATLLGSVYTVYDNTRKVVLSGKINSENTVIELGNLSGGIYLFSVGENLKQTFKVIKE